MASYATGRLDPHDKAMMKHFEEIRLHFNSYGRHAVRVPDEDEESDSEEEEEDDHYVRLEDGEPPTIAKPLPDEKPPWAKEKEKAEKAELEVAELPRDLAYKLYLSLKNEFGGGENGVDVHDPPVPKLK